MSHFSPVTKHARARFLRGQSAWWWWPVLLAVVVLAVLILGIWWLHGLIAQPAAAVRDGMVYTVDRAGQAVAEVYRDGKRVARRLLSGEVTSRFASYLAGTSQVNKLVLVERIHLEHFHETHVRGPSRAELDLLVPVEYHYYVDMSDKSTWAMTVVDGELQVVAPVLLTQRPIPHWEARREFIRKGLLIRDEPAKMDAIRDRVTAKAVGLARRPVRLAEARATARESLATWLREWVETSLLAEYEVRTMAIRFADEPEFPPVRYGFAVPDALPVER